MKQICFILSIFFIVVFFKKEIYAANYVETIKKKIVIYDEPNESSKKLYMASKSTIFEVIGSVGDYYLVLIYDGKSGYLYKPFVKMYQGALPPPVELFGFALPIQGEEIEVKKASTENSMSVNESIELLNNQLSIQELSEDEKRITQNSQRVIKTKAPIINFYAVPQMSSFNLPPNMALIRYPQIDMSGYFEGKYSGRNYSPKERTGPIWQKIRNDPYYRKLPQDVFPGDPQFEQKLQL